ncbi:hypothetical protein DSUL_20028 [Desulfovibrionales bacterium]
MVFNPKHKHIFYDFGTVYTKNKMYGQSTNYYR